MLTTREAIVLKVQDAYGTEATPDPQADALLCSAPSVANEGLRMLQRNNVKPTISTDQHIFGGTMLKLTFTCELKGSGTAGTVPEIGQALRCSGLDETVSAGTSVTYQPVSEGHEYATIYYFQDGRRYKLVDAIGTFTLTAEVGNFPTVQFEFTGKDGGLVDDSFPTISYNSTVPKAFVSVPFSVDSYNAVINSLTVNAGNTITTPGDSRDTWGFGQTRITQRDPNGTVDPLATTIAAKDFRTAFKDGKRMPLDTGVVGDTAGNRWRFSSSIALRDIGQGDRDQNRTDDLTFGCHETSGDDEYQLIFS